MLKQASCSCVVTNFCKSETVPIKENVRRKNQQQYLLRTLNRARYSFEARQKQATVHIDTKMLRKVQFSFAVKKHQQNLVKRKLERYTGN